MADFKYQKPFPIKKDNTEYKLISKDFVSTIEIDGRKILKVDPKALELLAEQAMADVSFFLRTTHLSKLTKIIDESLKH